MTKWSPNKAKNKSMIKMGSFRKLRFGSLSVNSIVIIGFVALGLFYIVAVNVTSTKGGQLHTLELQKKAVIAENERLELEAARLASLAVIEGGAQEKIEIGDDGKPTGRIFQETIRDDEDIEEITYVSKMVPMGGMDYIDSFGPLAHK